VGISEDRIAELGEVRSEAKRVINAEGLVVAPGFIDIHTHYDAQVLWDPTLSPSSAHGVTTIIGGNCGFSVAPIQGTADAEYLMRMLSRVEGMPLEALREFPWNWTSFDSYLCGIEGKVAINAGFMV